jgi:hypothetical protein
MRHFALTAMLLSGTVGLVFRGAQPAVDDPAGRFRGVVNIRERGAAGDGSTDDTSSIVAAFSGVCASGGGTIYIPAGTYIVNPASSAIPICSNLVVDGPGTIRVKANAGNYRYIFAAKPADAAVHDVTFSGITIDQNTANNTTATIAVGDEGSLQLIWQIWGGTNIHLENMRLYVCGVDPIDVNGQTISGVFIQRNYIVFQKRAGQPPFDNSSVYVHGDNFHVDDNTFVSTIADRAVTAVEVHGGSGSVRGNTIVGYEFGINLVDLNDASAAGNSIRGAAYGISLWSTKAMKSVVVSGNTVSIAQVTRRSPASYGIATSYNNGINGDFSNLQISGNVLTFEQETAARDITGAVNYGIGLQALGNIANVLVFGNQIIRAPVRGIAIGVGDARYTTTRVSVRDNQITDAGSNYSPRASDYSAGIALQGNLSAIDVVRNRLDFFSEPFIGHYAYWSSEMGFAFKDVIVADNYSTAATGTPANGLTPSVRQARPHE